MPQKKVLRVLRSFVGNFLSFHSRLSLYMMLYKRYKNEYKRIIMNDNWIEQKCRYCQYYFTCANINVLSPSNSYFNGLIDIEYSKRIQLNQICGLYQVYKGVMKSPKIILYLL